MFVNSYWMRKISLKLLSSLDASCIFYWMMWRTSSYCFRRSQSYRLIAPLFRPSQFKVSTINYTSILTQSNFILSNSWDAGMSILLLDVLWADIHQVWALYERSRKMLLFLVLITTLEVVTIVILLAFTILKAECTHPYVTIETRNL